MAKNSITDYDNLSSNNTDVQSVDISEGCSPSGINNAIREVMADLADVNDGTVALTSPAIGTSLDMNGNELILDADGDTSITADTDDQIDFKTGGSDTMYLTSTGLGIGVASPARILDISTTGSTSPRLTGTSSNGAYLDFHNNAATTGRFRVGQGYGSGTDNVGFLNNEANAAVVFGTNNAERMRIDSSGLLMVNTSTNVGTQVTFNCGNREGVRIINNSGATQYPMAFLNGTNTVGSISTSTTNTAYNTSSDYRLKENDVDMTGAITRVKQLQPKRFNFIADADTTVDGFMAHEVQTIVPEAITGTHNEVDDDGNPVYQGIDQSKLVPLLTGALKEAIAKIEALETRVTALENA